MVLLDKRSLKLEGVQDFEWSPKDDILCAYQSEQAGGNLPARISLIKLPERTELRQKNLFSVSGKYLLPCPCSLLKLLERTNSTTSSVPVVTILYLQSRQAA